VHSLRRFAPLVAIVAATVAALAILAPVEASAKTPCRTRCGDVTAPKVAIGAPAAASIVTGLVSLSGTASDNVSVASVAVSVDGGSWQTASGTTSWTSSWSSLGVANGSHSLTARATDTSGNQSTAVESVTVNNPVPDTIPPTVTISAPTGGATVAGSVLVSGSAGDNVALASVRVAVDGGSWQSTSGMASWSWAWATTGLVNGSHSVTLQATDTAGNTSTATDTVTVSNPPPPPPPPPSGTCRDGSAILQQAVTTEGVTIHICTAVGGWTTDRIDALLLPNARDLSLIGPDLTIEVQTTYSSSESTTAACCTNAGLYYNYHASVYLNPSSTQTFGVYPDAIMAHEYGHVWTNYWRFMNPANAGTWARYLTARGLAGDPRVDSTYNWSAVEMCADDYRRLFGDAAAQSQLGYINPAALDSQQVPGLANFFLTQWAIPAG
jgi:hypothetical protein